MLALEPRWDLNRKKVRQLLDSASLDAIVLLGSPNITYVTGIRDPTGVMILTKECGDYLLTPVLDYNRLASQAPKDVIVRAYIRREGEMTVGLGAVPQSDLVPKGLDDAVRDLLSSCQAKKVGADLSWASYSVNSLASAIGLQDVSKDISKVRSVKDDWEVEAILASIAAAEQAFREALQALEGSPSEAEVEAAFYSSLMRQGAWGEAFPTIVAFYDHTALPHHTPTTVRLQHPGPVLIDFGANMGGYVSDTTRTLWHGGGGAEFKKLIELVVEAQGAAIDVIGPGVEARDPDMASRRVLAREGLDKFYSHGLGHGVGVEVHEAPYLAPSSKDVLEPGNVVTVEPGFYIPGVHGVRVEDMVLVTKKGARLLTRLSRIIS
ncbi:MAG: Xaa-Pro peptidase family protein [Acidilobus sp.]|nr:Xaa-Pro peptidase family protein [Acidilobus sp.]